VQTCALPIYCRQLRVPPGDWLDPVYFGGPPVAWPRVRDGLCAPAYSQFSRPVRTRIILGWKVWNLCLPTTGGPGAANPGYTEDDPTKPIWPNKPAPVQALMICCAALPIHKTPSCCDY